MKKLFGFLTLFLCLLLTACNMNLLSDRSGSIDFSIPSKDIINAANNYAARSGDDEPAASYTFLVQIKGNRNYYKYQVKTVILPDIPDFVQSPYQQINYSQEYLSKENLDFSFTGLPLGQTYTVMFDMLVDPSGYSTPYSIFSGRTEGVTVSAGQSSDVGIKAKYHEGSNLSLIVDYIGGYESKNLRTTSYIQKKQESNDLGEEPWTLNLSKKNGKLYDEDKVIKDIYYVLDSDSNFISSAFNYSIPYFDNGHKYYKLNFKNNKCSVKSFLLRKLKTASFSGEVTISNSKIECPETLTTINLESKGNLVAQNKQGGFGLMFSPKKYDVVNSKWAYVASLQLSSIIDPYYYTVAPGDTVVLVLNVYEEPVIQFEKTQLYYKFSSMDISDGFIDGTKLFEDNNCINHQSKEKHIVIPLNNIKNPNDSLILFEDYGESAPTEQVMTISFTYYIFPSDMHVFAFGVGAAYDSDGNMLENTYRYEFNTSIGNMSLNGGNTVNAHLKGKFCTVNFSDKEYINLETEGYFENDLYITGELYDGGQYTPSEGESESFHPLSNNEATGNNKSMKVSRDALDYDYIGNYDFVFADILQPHTANGYKNDFRFLCTAACASPDILLLVQYFDLSFTKY